MREARHEAGLDRVRSEHEDDRDARGRGLGGAHGLRIAERDDDADLERGELGGECRQPLVLARRSSDIRCGTLRPST